MKGVRAAARGDEIALCIDVAHRGWKFEQHALLLRQRRDQRTQSHITDQPPRLGV